MPETEKPDTNIYDMRLVQHEDGWIYGLFCTERRDPMRTRRSVGRHCAMRHCPNKRPDKHGNVCPICKHLAATTNVVLHPEFVDGKYAFYTRPQDGFIEAGKGGGIGFGFCTIEHAVITEEKL